MQRNRSRQLKADLRSLPTAAPPRDVWPELAARIARQQQPKTLPRWFGYAAAALLVLSLGTVAMLSSRFEQQQLEQGQVQQQLKSQLAAWVAYSQDLESELRALNQRSGLLRGHQAVALGQLEQMVAAVDMEIVRTTDQDRQLRLWQRRTALLNDLVTVQADAVLQVPGEGPQPVITLNRPVGKARLVSYEM